MVENHDVILWKQPTFSESVTAQWLFRYRGIFAAGVAGVRLVLFPPTSEGPDNVTGLK
jgi:hypothetical protein